MSNYTADYRDMQEAHWLNKWVPLDDMPVEITREQYRYILAKKRESEARLKEINEGINAFRKMLKV